MTESSLPAAQTAADVLMRRLLNLMSRLNAVCSEDAEELCRLSERRQTDVAAAGRSARSRTEQSTSATHELSDSKSLGGRLRAELAVVLSVQHEDPGPAPVLFDDAVAEW